MPTRSSRSIPAQEKSSNLPNKRDLKALSKKAAAKPSPKEPTKA